MKLVESVPSSISNSYPIIGEPPSSGETLNAIVIELSEAIENVGLGGASGTLAASNIAIGDQSPHPYMFLALYLNLYDFPFVRDLRV